MLLGLRSSVRGADFLKSASLPRDSKRGSSRLLGKADHYQLAARNLSISRAHFTTRSLQPTAESPALKQTLRRLGSAARTSQKRMPSDLGFKMGWPKITLFGDSITRYSMNVDEGCWAAMIYSRVAGFFDVDIRGFSGYNSRWGLEMMPRQFPKSYLDQVEIFVPFFGHNDSWDSKNPLHIPVDEFESNMRSIIKYLLDHGVDKSKIIMITPSWYHHETFQVYLAQARLVPTGKSYEEAKGYAEAVLRIGHELDIEVLDIFKKSYEYSPHVDLFCDGVHYSRVGAKLLYDNLMPVIERKVKQKFGKSLVDLVHEVPFEKRPEVAPLVEAYFASLGEK